VTPPASAETPGNESTPAVGRSVGEPGRLARRQQAVLDALRAVVRDIHDAHHGAVAPGAPDLELKLRLRARPSAGWAVEFDPPLEAQIAGQLDTLHARVGVYREGAVHCFKCGSSVCDHATPPGPLSVFAGYDPMGRPEWRELGQWLLERHDPRVADVFESPGRPVTATVMGRELRRRQMAEFGRASRTYSILGQVVAGYFCAGEEPADRFALTIQIVECRGTAGRREIRLNTVGGPVGGGLEDWLGADRGAGVARARAAALRAVSQMDRLAAGLPADAPPDALRAILSRVPAVLRRLADAIERSARQSGRRTRHAERRRLEDRRPVPKALEDVAGAPPEAFFYDEKAETFVVCGPQGRTHVFNAGGRHVTSFTLSPGAVGLRLRRARWLAVPPDRVEGVRAAIAGAVRP